MAIGAKARRLATVLAVFLSTPAAAQDRAGDFDHYLLALSWTPTWCAETGDSRADPRCAAGAGVGWSLHGLWPQHAGGAWPEYCPTGHRAPSRGETAAQADIFGTAGAAWHQWNKHGRCTGLSARDYYALARESLARLTLPAVFAAVEVPLVVDPDVIEAAFAEANPGLTPAMMVTTCRGSAIAELRLCLTRDLEPRPCDRALELRACALDAARLAPPR